MRTDTKNIVATMAYLTGVRKSAWISSYGNECSELLTELENNRNATTIRYLCKLRTTLMQRFKKTDLAIVHDCKNIDHIEWYDTENIRQLEKWGYTILLANKRASDYSLHFNTLIRDNIDKCRALFPDWIAWEYVKNHLPIIVYYTS